MDDYLYPPETTDVINQLCANLSYIMLEKIALKDTPKIGLLPSQFWPNGYGDHKLTSFEKKKIFVRQHKKDCICIFASLHYRRYLLQHKM